MSIRDYAKKIKGIARGGKWTLEIVFSLVIILTAFASFGLGKLSVQEIEKNDTVSIVGAVSMYNNTISNNVESSSVYSVAGNGIYVASRNGTKYYPPACGGASRINEENKIWFNSSIEAESAGFTRSSTCVY